jgi:hypothetical protein
MSNESNLADVATPRLLFAHRRGNKVNDSIRFLVALHKLVFAAVVVRLVLVVEEERGGGLRGAYG